MIHGQLSEEAVRKDDHAVEREGQKVDGRRSDLSEPPKADLESEASLFRQLEEEAKKLEKSARECPVPKPSGILGHLLGFQTKSKEMDGGQAPRPPLIVENSGGVDGPK